MIVEIKAELVVTQTQVTNAVPQWFNPLSGEWEAGLPSQEAMDVAGPGGIKFRDNPDSKQVLTLEKRELVFEYEKKEYRALVSDGVVIDATFLTRQAAEVTVIKPERWVNNKQEVVEEATPVITGVIVKKIVVDPVEDIKIP